jgi:hypothetical protein
MAPTRPFQLKQFDGMNLLDHNFDGYALDGQRGNDMRVFVRALAVLGVFAIPSLISTATAATSIPSPIRGTPGPLVGAGLPLLLVAGGLTAYWLVRRYRRSAF